MRIGIVYGITDETCPSATLPLTNPSQIDLGSNLGCHGQKLVTNCLSCGMADAHASELSQNFQILVQTLPILSEASWFSSVLEGKSDIVSQFMPQTLHSTSLPIH